LSTATPPHDATMPVEDFSSWTGRSEARECEAAPAPAIALAATPDREDFDAQHRGQIPLLPPLWHWLYFLPTAATRDLDEDGHPRRGGFLPPVPLPRRMWAGGRLEFHRPLRMGDALRRISRITDISSKQGRSGALVFVTVRHEVSGPDGLAITEEQDIVYRDAVRPAHASAATASPARSATAAAATPDCATFSREVRSDPVLLFRYSALTFNSHRIHYDRDYATKAEGSRPRGARAADRHPAAGPARPGAAACQRPAVRVQGHVAALRHPPVRALRPP
jgi:3-methylfumaryl-CoA hydratase